MQCFPMYVFLNPTDMSLFHLQMPGVKSTKLGQISHVRQGRLKSALNNSCYPKITLIVLRLTNLAEVLLKSVMIHNCIL